MNLTPTRGTMMQTMDDELLTGYNVHSRAERTAMLRAVGVDSIEDLFRSIPRRLRLRRELDLPAPLPEWELERHLRELADANATTRTMLSFIGGGVYEHYIPAVVDAVVERGEFLTAYTPYQPEMSQGLLQGLAEYQEALGKLRP